MRTTSVKSRSAESPIGTATALRSTGCLRIRSVEPVAESRASELFTQTVLVANADILIEPTSAT